MIRFLLVISLLTSCSLFQDKKEFEVPKGWFLSPRNSKLYVKKAKEKKKGYKINFDRSITSKENEYYVRIAESIYPEQETIRNFTPIPFVKNANIENEPNYYFERRWWVEEFQNKLIPYALVSDAISKYIEYYREFKSDLKKARKKDDEYGKNEKRVDFKYIVTVTKNEIVDISQAKNTEELKEENLLISKEELKKRKELEKEIRERNEANKVKPKTHITVNMDFHWYQYCGWPCGWGFKLKRTVVFENPKKVISVSGDGELVKWASNPDDPYGLEWYYF